VNKLASYKLIFTSNLSMKHHLNYIFKLNFIQGVLVALHTETKGFQTSKVIGILELPNRLIVQTEHNLFTFEEIKEDE